MQNAVYSIHKHRYGFLLYKYMNNADYSNCKNRRKDLLVSLENKAINPSETLYGYRMFKIVEKSLWKNNKGQRFQLP